ncbi:MAG: PilZ domain-containing protein [Eubacteriales bacterium]
MNEQRKSNRLELNTSVTIKMVSEKDAKEILIKILDVSKVGMGFECDKTLEMGSIFEGNIQIWTHEVIHTFMEIVRIKQVGDLFIYGAIFVGMPNLESTRISIYDLFEQSKKGEL